MRAFREALASLAGVISSESGLPLVVIIDELDRCRPTFAVSVLERIKHVLDGPRVVYLFVLHRDQLEESVRAIYGREIDAAGYLAKFVHIWCALPKQRGIGGEPSDYAKYCRALYDSHQISAGGDERDLSIRDRTRNIPNICAFFDMYRAD